MEFYSVASSLTTANLVNASDLDIELRYVNGALILDHPHVANSEHEFRADQ